MRSVPSGLFVLLALGLVIPACVGDDPTPVGPSSNTDGGTTPPPPGTQVDPPGKACATNDDCAGHTCVDGFCCNAACTGSCEACNLPGKEGTCSPVPAGSPVGAHTACAGSGACAGTCDGTSSQCQYPATSVICGASCDGNCDGSGKCTSVAGGTCPNGFACGASSCLTACSGDNNCQPFFHCNTSTSKCERVAESDCLDGKDNNGDGLADCADPTCNAAVKCVSPAAATGELGLLQTTGTCPAGYDTVESWHAGLQANACTGCSCYSTCGTSVTVWGSDTGCTTGGYSYTTSGRPLGIGTVYCKGLVPVTTYVSGTRSQQTVDGCVGSGTATQADPTWATNTTFCVAKTSATCTGNKVCVAATTAKVCARGNQGDACPGGYASDQGLLYSTFQKGSCTGSCTSCNKATAMTCNATSIAYVGSNCTGAGSFIDQTCGVLNRGTYAAVGTGFTSSGTDNCTNNITDVPPQPTGAAHFCCEP